MALSTCRPWPPRHDDHGAAATEHPNANDDRYRTNIPTRHTSMSPTPPAPAPVNTNKGRRSVAIRHRWASRRAFLVRPGMPHGEAVPGRHASGRDEDERHDQHDADHPEHIADDAEKGDEEEVWRAEPEVAAAAKVAAFPWLGISGGPD